MAQPPSGRVTVGNLLLAGLTIFLVLWVPLAGVTRRIISHHFSVDLVAPLLDPSLAGPAEKREALARIIASPAYKTHAPSRGIVFVKTHKTGGSTVTSVLHALATAHKLRCAIPPTLENDLRQDKQRDFVRNEIQTSDPTHYGSPFDVWADHVVFDRVLIDEAVPSAEGKVLTITRDPAERMHSWCLFLGCCPADLTNTSVFASFILGANGTRLLNSRHGLCRREQTTFQLVGSGLESNQTQIQGFFSVIRKIASGQWLALVTERFDESMLVLQHEYGLHPLDITYVKMKVNRPPVPPDDPELLEAAEKLVRRTNFHDQQIHNHANLSLETKLRALYGVRGNKREVALEKFRKLNSIVHEACLWDEEKDSEVGKWCAEKAMDDTVWLRHHRKSSLQRLNETLADLRQLPEE
mmetsp:Transcript_21219/g.51771  ORF Transcript_21219/g.51771 Transcript_21219/m.51771 type:complete len:411 (+) Transcript_21219:41-1273(+)